MGRDWAAVRPKALAVSALLAVVFGSLHVADEAIRGEQTAQPLALAVVPVVILLYAYGAVVSLREDLLGLVIVLIISAVGFYAVFVSHVFGLTGLPDLEDIGRETGPAFVWVVIGQGTSSLAAIILSAELLWRRRARR